MVAAAAIAVGTGASAATIVNGGFESGSDGSDVFSVIGSGPLPGWTVASGNVEIISNNYWESAEGGYSLDLDGVLVGSIFQDVTGLNVGSVYRLGFAMSSNPNEGVVVHTLGVNAGPAYQTFTHTATGSLQNMEWTYHSLDFTAMSSVERVMFTSISGGTSAAGPALDDVTLELISTPKVPVPASALLLVTAIGGIGAVRRRKS
ncbi:hypothetical protein OB2597_01207 [Pseudooceanicola batsensis HTCC2597]|uniref:DUF642 domain-containing protein n=2 Tax=Pseudooceanicola batsensis TaxID=314255 RepID=A3U2T4_PSEBH|nr:hypothetical protein OB2597_01207 [Pseudooceanicola batsensis HTCC2597]